MKKFWSLITSVLLVMSLMVMPVTTVTAAEKSDDIVVIYTNDVHCQVDVSEKSLGYATVAAYKKEMQEKYNHVALVDCGDAIQGGPIGTLSKGTYLVDIMNEVGYDYAVPGNHEFDYGMTQFLEVIVPRAEYKYLCGNFKSLETGKTVLDAYSIATYGNKKVAFIGIDTPESFSKSTPKYFQDEAGNYIYSFSEGDNGKELYSEVQKNIDAAKAAGADYIVAIAHLGVDEQSSPWMSTEVIANTSGLDVVLDGHSHSVIDRKEVKDKAGDTVILSSTGTRLANIGKLVIAADGKITTELVSSYEGKDEKVAAYVADINAEFNDMLEKIVAKSDVQLSVTDPATGIRLIRSQETNLGDLCADAYRTITGADVGFVNGGGIRVDIKAGDISYNDVILVHPFGNALCVVEAKGQEIVDALEMGSRLVGEAENGGFLQVSGLKYTINTAVPSTVEVDDKGTFVKVTGERRVTDVQILNAGGEYEAIVLDKTYTLASHDYMLKNAGDGINMFTDNKILQDSVMLDNQVLITYIQDYLNGVVGKQYKNVSGEGRITIIAEAQTAPEEVTTEPETTEELPEAIEETTEELPETTEAEPVTTETLPETGTAPIVIYFAAGAALIALGGVVVMKDRKKQNQN